jgi:hypothetical protein
LLPELKKKHYGLTFYPKILKNKIGHLFRDETKSSKSSKK